MNFFKPNLFPEYDLGAGEDRTHYLMFRLLNCTLENQNIKKHMVWILSWGRHIVPLWNLKQAMQQLLWTNSDPYFPIKDFIEFQETVWQITYKGFLPSTPESVIQQRKKSS